MRKLVECVPNFSEGRRPEVVAQIIDTIKSVEGVRVLGASTDASHNRAVVTFLGEPGPVKNAAFLAAASAAELINMEEHQGAHPRIGATDVIPFIPIGESTMEECVELARELGREIGYKLNIPVYLYEAAATRPERKNLPAVRKGEYEGLKTAITRPERQPDFGPPHLHPTAGATAVGARPPLVAYNINLGTADVVIAKAIAKSIRGSSGGYPSIKALGVMLEDRQVAQVTINVCNYKEVSLHRVFETVKTEAARYGVNVIGSEIVGLLPMEALLDAADFYLRLEGFSFNQVLEKRLLDQ
ncbi:glutamate formiminotransferase [Desulfotomaculum arcticum]|uniref:glutamate formimidoyltransferase n=1 Tax=Desulfotruncus arcticus DSM 17038 TaxID=1121424 RepID=A0A1I2ZQ14_9FIRM|nr:glutamate formimidoyltransferase [Desulfotruncus arcticus]SFH39937.1 glutamate formiminotransferase [Desulfotomaculum arcticum] [Desulfotruncus arcticus DSM 17038]